MEREGNSALDAPPSEKNFLPLCHNPNCDTSATSLISVPRGRSLRNRTLFLFDPPPRERCDLVGSVDAPDRYDPGTSPRVSNPLEDDFVSLRDVARSLRCSHSAAYSLAVSGLLGDPLQIGRAHFYRRDVADRVIAARRRQLRHSQRAPLALAEVA